MNVKLYKRVTIELVDALVKAELKEKGPKQGTSKETLRKDMV